MKASAYERFLAKVNADDFEDPGEGYPSDAEMAMLREWDGTPRELLDFLGGVWWPVGAPWLTVSAKVDENAGTSLGYVMREGSWEPLGFGEQLIAFYSVHLSTGGWSGNEDRIDALERSGRLMDFWARYWQVTRRGGHYEFLIPADQWNHPIVSLRVSS